MQESAGVVLTMFRFLMRKPIDTLFGIALFVWQLFFVIWTYIFDETRRWLVRIITLEIIILTIIYGLHWFQIFLLLSCWIFYSLVRGRIPLRLVFIAARVTHVRLCLEKVPGTNRWRYISQSAPDAKMDEWSDDQLLGTHFIYMAPGFDRTQIFISNMIEYARGHVGDRGKRGYDYLQAISIFLNSILFWWIPGLHGKEIIKFMNLPGFKEVCSTLVAAILRWAYEILYVRRIFFPGLDTAMVPPCLFPIEAYLKRTWILPDRWQRKLNAKAA